MRPHFNKTSPFIGSLCSRYSRALTFQNLWQVAGDNFSQKLSQGPEMGPVLETLFEENLELSDVCSAGMTGLGSWQLAQPGGGGGFLLGSGSNIRQLLDADPQNAHSRKCLFVDEHTCIGVCVCVCVCVCYKCAILARNV